MASQAALELRVPAAGLPRWGDGAKALCDAVGGRWPADQTKRMQLCHLVAWRADKDCWEVDRDNVARFTRLAGGRVLGDSIQLPLGAGA